MKLPPGKTESEVLTAIEKAVKILAPQFVFGTYGREDIEQEARMYGLESLQSGKYDPSRPLENFVYTHIKNRLINLVRNKLRRNDAPCARCHAGNPCGDNRQPCEKYVVWRDRNQAKANLMRPLDLNHIADEKEPSTRMDSTVVEDAEIGELLQMIDARLPVELRATYLQMRAGVSVPKPRRVQVEEAVKEIIGETCQSAGD